MQEVRRAKSSACLCHPSKRCVPVAFLSGKTVILKLLGLLALMARCGIPVPADHTATLEPDSVWERLPTTNLSYRPRVDFFRPVLAVIGDLQSVGGDLSTFSGHMLVCREVLNNSGRNALVLMDELGSGTDPNQGVAIAQALLEAVVATGARVAITTHYLQLKQLAASDERFAVAGMQFVNGRPTYKLLPGTVGESFALAVAERLGLPSAVLARANELLDSETRQMGDLIREMEDQKALVDQQVAELARRQQEMTALENKMKEEAIRLENKQLDARRIEARKFAKMLEEKESVLENILEKLKADPSRRVLAKSWDDIKFVKRDALNEAENVPSVVARKQKAVVAMEAASAELIPIVEMREKPVLAPGDKVVICDQGAMFGREATVIKVLDSRVEVKVNNMNVSFKLAQIALPPATSRRPGSYQRPNDDASSLSGTAATSRAKAVEQALASEGTASRRRRQGPSVDETQSSRDANDRSTVSSSSAAMRTESNTVDVRGCNLMEAQERVRSKFSAALMAGRPVVYILHGHGTGGVLKTKLRAWLVQERHKLVKEFGPADQLDGGDAVTRVVVQ
jgi:DNA mismatch repair protein MutS2